ncbi:MAG: hypothetical protein ISR52_09870, partial [Rhodospirillales bacterium]|nr:hypothetical protein [Rhodospirillales bacterium]
MSQAPKKVLFSAERAMLKKRGLLNEGGAAVAADNTEVLKAIEDLKVVILKATEPKVADDLPEVSVLRAQLNELRDSIERTKKEIASVRQPGADDTDDDKLVSAALELDAIVSATEVATHNILNAAEDIDDKVDALKERVTDQTAVKMLEEISGLTIKILEACNFQDITGQRTSKVVNTIHYLEERIGSMINIWGVDEIAKVEVETEAEDEDAALLKGPQLEGAGISQDDIDS